MEFVKGKPYITADIRAELVQEMHIGRWYKPGLILEYVRRHTEYRDEHRPELRKHIVNITLSNGGKCNFWVYECVIQARCVWNNV